jgi:hypothetical protein
MLVTTRHHQIGFALLWLWGTFFAIGSSGYVLDQEEIQKPLFADEQKPLPSKPDTGTLPALLDALDVLQGDYFAIWLP